MNKTKIKAKKLSLFNCLSQENLSNSNKKKETFKTLFENI